jgi:osmotically-inducible protein OsmY
MTQILQQTDGSLKRAIDLELEWTPMVHAAQIGVAVTDGAVTLSGQVQTYPEKRHALHAAMQVSGVTAVAEDIVVHHTWDVPGDADIAREAEAAFARTTVVPAGSVKAEVHDHRVTLSGSVDWQYQREAAFRAVESLPGVSAVWNSITVTPKVGLSASDAKSKITAALARHAQIDADHVHVAVNGNEIILTGTASSLAERRHAEDAAWCTPGVASVENRLIVRS